MRTIFTVSTILAMGLGNLYAADSEEETTNTKDSSVIKQEVIGNVRVTAEAKNHDFASQMRAERKRKQNKSKKAKKRSFRDKDKKEEDSSGEISVKFEWPAKR